MTTFFTFLVSGLYMIFTCYHICSCKHITELMQTRKHVMGSSQVDKRSNQRSHVFSARRIGVNDGVKKSRVPTHKLICGSVHVFHDSVLKFIPFVPQRSFCVSTLIAFL